MESGGSSGSFTEPSAVPQGGLYPGPMSPNPHLPQPRAPRLTKEEINILEECNTESFWYRCVPLGVALGGATTYLVKTGHLKPHPRYGSTLKTLGAVFVGYVLGKLSYQSTCQQKILEKIPHTSLAQSVRKARGISSVYEEQLPVESAAVPPPGGKKVGKIRQDSISDMDSSTDISSRSIKELDDTFRPSLDREVKSDPEEAMSVEPEKERVTYHELRHHNRQEYEHQMATSPHSPFRQPPFSRRPSTPTPVITDDSLSSSEQSAQQPSAPRPIWDMPPPQSPGRVLGSAKGQKNQYGDVWDRDSN